MTLRPSRRWWTSRRVLACGLRRWRGAVQDCSGVTEEMVGQLLRINAVRWGVRYGDEYVAKMGMGPGK